MSVQKPNSRFIDQKLDFLKWNYERCQIGYHSRDQMTHDIFYKMIGVLYWHMIFLSLPFVTKLSNNSLTDFISNLSNSFLGISLKWWYFFYVLFIAFIGFLSLFILLLILSNMINCKIALRKQCTFIEEKINNRYLQEIASFSQGRKCSFHRDQNAPIGNCFMKTYTGSLVKNCSSGFPKDLDKRFNQHWECICKREGWLKSTFDEEKTYILWTGFSLLALWTLICLIILYVLWQL